MFKIDLKNRKPIYEQVIENFRRLIISGRLKEGDRVPSVRDMARELNVNPNTVQKAYRELEARKYFYTVLGQGSFISAPPEETGEIDALLEQLHAIVRELIFRGKSKDEIVIFIEETGGQNDKR
ncbi:MAG: GntR family transcriptional regulator [Defluviitaleaceae bacterium]|nr:GntR family transcriptional regulator [Defluviitaleaceae bacterium]